MDKRSKYVGKSIWRLDNSYEFILEETSKYVRTDTGAKILKVNINFQPRTGMPVELGEWEKNN